MLEIIQAILQYVVVPLVAWNWLLHSKIEELNLKIAVVETRVASDKVSHDKDIIEIRRTSEAILTKLDSIEAYLRK
jgi:hypothetical protein